MFKKLKIDLPSVVLTVIVNLLITGAIIAYANWTPPPDTAPTCRLSEPGCNAPINVGDRTQLKFGALGVGGILRVDSNAYVSGTIAIGTTALVKKATLGIGSALVGSAGTFGAEVNEGDGMAIVGTGTAAPFVSFFNGPTAGGGLGLALGDAYYLGTSRAGDLVLEASTGDLHLASRRGGTGNIHFDTQVIVPLPLLDSRTDLTRMTIRNDGTVLVPGSMVVGTSTAPVSTFQVVGNYMQIPVVKIVLEAGQPEPKAPPKADCDSPEEAGRMIIWNVTRWQRPSPQYWEEPLPEDQKLWICTGKRYVGDSGFPSHTPIYESGWAISELAPEPERLP